MSVRSYESVRLQQSLGELSKLAQEKILETLRDKSIQITYGSWVDLLDKYDIENEPKACGCLMLDGYLKEHPEVIVFEKTNTYSGTEHWSFQFKDAGLDLADVLTPYYKMEHVEDANYLIDTVASTFDNYMKITPRVGKYIGGLRVLNGYGRRQIIKMIERNLDARKWAA